MTARKLHFRTSTRMIKILGEHLIRDATLGLLELIKNCYDADAENVEIHLLDLKEPSSTHITIKDDGNGMTIDDIENSWFMLAGSAKEEFKETKVKTKLGRIPLGEKGVGRFAAQKISRKFEMATRPNASDVEYALEIDWDKFVEKEKTLDDITIEIQERQPKIFKGKDHGTFLKMAVVREPWKKHDLVKLQTALIRLFSPGPKKTDFNIKLYCPEYPEIEKLTRIDILKKFQYSIDCKVDKQGIGKYTFRIREPNGNVEETTEEVNLWARTNPDSWISQEPECGPFRFRIFAWILSVDNLEKYGLSRIHLKELSGISIFRDGFRILPYGDIGDDWLRLDMRRVNNPSKFFSNNQVIGIIDTDQTSNPSLVDKTNREGVLENTAFFDIRDIALAVIAEIESKSFDHRNKITKLKKNEKPEAKDIKKEIAQIKQELTQLQNKQAEIIEDIPASSDLIKENIIVPKDDYENLVRAADYLEKAFEEFSGTEDENKESFYHLCAMGIAAERFVHEFDRLISILEKQTNEIEKIAGRDSTQKMRYAINVLKSELGLVTSLKYVEDEEHARKTSPHEVMEEILKFYDDDLHEASIKVAQEGSNFTLSIKKSSLGQVFDNILNNAIYWLKQKSMKSDRWLKIIYKRDERKIEIINSGPPIPNNIMKKIFKQPFVTSKPSGRGLGMFISNKIMELNKGKIQAVNGDNTVSFVITIEENNKK